jgi:hypothetical protein
MSKPEFASFWRGTLMPFEQACLRSIVIRGYRITLYSYEPLSGVPEGVETADAREIAPEASAGRFIYNGRADLSHFSDYFRYNLSLKSNRIWIDTDMLLVAPFPDNVPETFVARERDNQICPAILRLPSNDPRLPKLVAATEDKMDRNLVWAETGPKLMTQVFGNDTIMRDALPPPIFYAIPHQEFWRAFIPQERQWCEKRTSQSVAVHLWNNIVTSLGYWKKIAPPEGSYLYERFSIDGSLDLFADFYPEKIMTQMVENYRLRLSGGAIGVGSIVRQAVPSVKRSWRYRYGG